MQYHNNEQRQKICEKKNRKEFRHKYTVIVDFTSERNNIICVITTIDSLSDENQFYGPRKT